MGQTTFDWTLNRIHGAPEPDGYGVQDISVVTGAADYSLGANSVYRLISAQDFRYTLLDLTAGESSVTAIRGVRVQANTVEYVTTTSTRKVLSVMRVSADGTLEVRKMGARSGR